MKSLLTTFTACLLLGMSSVQANDQTYTYYDVGEAKTVTLIPDYVAEFSNSSNVQARALGESAVQSLNPGAQLTDQGSGNVRIWKVDDSTGNIQARSTSTSGNVSPVFRHNGGLRALPGGIIVEFAESQTQAQVENWAASRGYTIKSKLSFGNFYVIDSPAGLETLTLANQLQASGEVVSATPDWWQQRSKR